MSPWNKEWSIAQALEGRQKFCCLLAALLGVLGGKFCLRFDDNPQAAADCVEPAGRSAGIALLSRSQEYLRALANHVRPTPGACAAWGEFFLCYDPLIRRYAARFQLNGADQDDCAQEVWAELVRRLPDFHYKPERGRFESWLYTMVRSKAMDELRARQSHRQSQLPANCPWTEPSVSSARNEAEGIPTARQMALQKALAELRRIAPVRSYRILEMRWFEGHSVADIAIAMDLTAKQVRARDYCLRKQLRRLIENQQIK